MVAFLILGGRGSSSESESMHFLAFLFWLSLGFCFLVISSSSLLDKPYPSKIAKLFFYGYMYR